MKVEHIERIQRYRGDGPEEQWKPKLPPKEPYVDVYYYWEFRQALQAGDLCCLRPAEEGTCISKKALQKHERLAGYWYSAYIRLASMHESLDGLRRTLLVYPEPLDLSKLRFFLEAFYHFLGSVLDMIGGVGNIIYGFRGEEDSFTKFKNRFEAVANRNPIEQKAMLGLNELARIRDYRDRITHRSVFAQILDKNPMRTESGQVPAWDVRIEKGYKKVGPQYEKMWRKVIRDILEGRLESVSVHSLCEEHLRKVEESSDLLFQCFLQRVPRYLTTNKLRLVTDKYSGLADPAAPPSEAKYVFYHCRAQESRLYWCDWLQPTSKPIKTCVNPDCDSEDIVPLFFVSK